MQFFLILCFSSLIGYFTALQASKRGRRAEIWFLIGLFSGLLGLLFLFLLPSLASNSEIMKKAEGDQPSSGSKEKSQHSFVPPQEWFYVDNTKNPIGPVSFQTLKTAWEKGEISPHFLVWHEGLSNWTNIKELNLFDS